MGEFANLILIFTLVISSLSIILPIIIGKIASITKANQYIFDSFLLQTFLNFLSLAMLIYFFIEDDFSIKTVALNSGITLSTFYKVAASWSNHQGSLLLWEFFITSFTMIFFFTELKGEKCRFDFLYYQSVISTFFLLFIYTTSNPFEKLYPRAVNGQGLNPILQDLALSIHPPILFAAYALFTIIYSMTIVRSDYKSFFQYKIKIVIKLVFLLMTLAVGLGSWWAYRELGWGGFWFWDPVENSSLLPWLISLALLHGITLPQNLQSSATVFLLGIFGFISSLVATFLVRSGLLTSVHSFATDTSKGIFLLFAVMIFIFLAFIHLLKIKNIDTHQNNSYAKSLISINIAIVVIYFFTIAIGTFFPIAYELIYGYKIIIGENYYNQISKFFALATLLAMIFASFSDKIFGNMQKIQGIVISIVLALVFILFANKFLNISNQVALLMIILALAVIISQFYAMLEVKNWGTVKDKAAMYLAHIGFALFVISVILQHEKSFDIEAKVQIGQGSYYNDEFYIELEDIVREKNDNYMSVRANFKVLQNGHSVGSLYPEMRFYFNQDVKTNEVSILKVSYLNDLYATVERLEESDYLYLRLQYKPLMSLLWISVFIMAISVAFSIKRKKYES